MKQKDRETWRDGMGRDNEQKCLAGWDGTKHWRDAGRDGRLFGRPTELWFELYTIG